MKAIFSLLFMFAIVVGVNASQPVFDASTDNDRQEFVDVLSQDLHAPATVAAEVVPSGSHVAVPDDPLTGVTYLIHSEPLAVNLIACSSKVYDPGEYVTAKTLSANNYTEPIPPNNYRIKFRFNTFRC